MIFQCVLKLLQTKGFFFFHFLRSSVWSFILVIFWNLILNKTLGEVILFEVLSLGMGDLILICMILFKRFREGSLYGVIQKNLQRYQRIKEYYSIKKKRIHKKCSVQRHISSCWKDACWRAVSRDANWEVPAFFCECARCGVRPSVFGNLEEVLTTGSGVCIFFKNDRM